MFNRINNRKIVGFCIADAMSNLLLSALCTLGAVHNVSRGRRAAAAIGFAGAGIYAIRMGTGIASAIEMATGDDLDWEEEDFDEEFPPDRDIPGFDPTFGIDLRP